VQLTIGEVCCNNLGLLKTVYRQGSGANDCESAALSCWPSAYSYSYSKSHPYPPTLSQLPEISPHSHPRARECVPLRCVRVRFWAQLKHKRSRSAHCPHPPPWPGRTRHRVLCAHCGSLSNSGWESQVGKATAQQGPHGSKNSISWIVGPSVASKMLRRNFCAVTGSNSAWNHRPSVPPVRKVVHCPCAWYCSSNL